jgi:hypothetical protein
MDRAWVALQRENEAEYDDGSISFSIFESASPSLTTNDVLLVVEE